MPNVRIDSKTGPNPAYIKQADSYPSIAETRAGRV